MKVALNSVSLFFLLNMMIHNPCSSQDRVNDSLRGESISFVAPALSASMEDARIDSIQEDVGVLRQKQDSVTFLNEGFNLLGVLSNVIGLVSIIIAVLTVYGIDKVRTNNVNKKTQYRLFVDMLRHLYRNKVCTLAMYGKWKEIINEGKKCYPSEEHFLKLQMLPEDIHFERYYQDPDKYHLMHEMELLLRNYNTEIEVAKSHVCNPDIDLDTKERDFATLNFKTGYLTLRIVELMYALNEEKTSFLLSLMRRIKSPFQKKDEQKLTLKTYCDEVVAIVTEEHRAKEEFNKKNRHCPEVLEVLNSLFETEREEDPYYKKIFADNPKCFECILRADIEIEAGYNSKDKEKIHIIQMPAK